MAGTKDQRLKVFRSAIEELLESLDAFLRVAQWNEPEQPPHPLHAAATKLLDRLGAADRLASSTFVGTQTEAGKVTAICAALKRLDAAYVVYRQKADWGPNRRAAASAKLEETIGEVKSDAHQWR